MAGPFCCAQYLCIGLAKKIAAFLYFGMNEEHKMYVSNFNQLSLDQSFANFRAFFLDYIAI